ncbi:MAG TPA: FHA domain-containing protein [Ktedonobacteraceae bacterium]
MDKCPYCNAETRPGDNFCLNCGNRLPVGGSPQPAPGGLGDATLAADENWVPPVVQAESNGHDLTSGATIAAEGPFASAIENPARMTLRTDSGETLQEFVLDKSEFAIGRAPSSDILLSKDKLTSRRHATIRYENGSYLLSDERSANGTFVNGQQLEEKAPYKLQNGDRVAIGEYEMLFHSTTPSQVDIESLPTMMVNIGSAETYATREDPQNTSATSDEFGTRPWNPAEASKSESAAVAAAATAAVAEPMVAVASPVAPIVETPQPIASTNIAVAPTPVTPLEPSNVTFSRLTSLPQPQLPDVAPLMAALATLDGQVSSLQEQLNATQEAMRNHELDIAQTTSQLRSGVRRVSERMDGTIADVARSREQLAWAELLQLMEDVMNNPRDIEYVTKLARKARELNKVFQIHQNVLNTLAECTSLLRSLIGEDRS